MKNQQSLYLCHMTAEEKKEYNKRYYQEHKDYWEDYYGRKMGGGNLTGAAKVARDNAVAQAVSARMTQVQSNHREALDALNDKIARIKRDKATSSPNSRVLPQRGIPDSGAMANQKISVNGRSSMTRDANETRSKAVGRSYSGVLTPSVKKSKLSQITSSAVSKGKSLLSGFAKLWKSGLSELKPRTTTTFTVYHTGSYSPLHTSTSTTTVRR